MRATIVTSLVGLAISATSVSAACNQASLLGIWHCFDSTVVFRDDSSVVFTFLEDCTFRITRGGVARNSICIEGDSGLPWGATNFTINGDCSIEAETEFCDVTGQVSKDKETVSGIGFCCCHEEEAGSGDFTLSSEKSFTLVKKTPGGGGVAVGTTASAEPGLPARRVRSALRLGAPPAAD